MAKLRSQSNALAKEPLKGIVVIYLAVGVMPAKNVSTYCKKFIADYKSGPDGSLFDTRLKLTHGLMVVPTRDQATRVEIIRFN